MSLVTVLRNYSVITEFGLAQKSSDAVIHEVMVQVVSDDEYVGAWIGRTFFFIYFCTSMQPISMLQSFLSGPILSFWL